MIKDRIIISRYAEAFFSFARHNLGSEKTLSDLRNLKNILEENPGLSELLQSPEIVFADKCRIINESLLDISRELKDFLFMLLEKKRIEYISDIAEYIHIKYSDDGQLKAVLKSASDIGAVFIRNIQEALEKKFVRRLKLYHEIDKSLIGGVQVVIGNTIIDGSVKRQLEDLKDQLLKIKLN